MIIKVKDLPKNPIDTTIKMLGCKWKIKIVSELLNNGTMRFCELKKSLKGITQKVLTTKLRQMQELGIIDRKEYNEATPKVEYTLTDIGYTLRPVIDSYTAWGKDYKKYVKLIEKHNK